MESKSILKRKAVQKGKSTNDIIVELSDEDRLAGHIPDEYYKLARDHNVFYEDKKLGKLVRLIDLTVGDEEPASSLSIRGLDDMEEGCTPTDAKVLRRANHDLIEENQELLEALKQATMLVEGAYPSDNKLIWASVTIFRTLIAEIEGE